MISIILILLCIPVLIPVAMFSLQCFLSFLPATRNSQASEVGSRPRLATLIPAHNEADGISNTLHDVLGQKGEGDRVLVIADNCTDDTAEVSRKHGVEATVRNNPDLRGKSYALKHGLAVLADDPPDVVIVVDADCRLSPNALEDLGAMAAATNRPVQGSYIFGGREGSAASNLASSLTLRFKNHIRPLGSSRIGMPCQLTGSGMAFPWHVFQKVDVANGALAEDTELGACMVLSGYPPVYCAEAKIDGSVPKAWGTHVQQRRRWEQGYLQTIFANAPRTFLKSITNANPSLLWSALDLCIPPLALLGLAWFVLFCVSAATGLMGGGWVPLYMLSIGAVLMGSSIVLGWFIHCRKEVGLKSLVSIPWFVIRKVSIYTSLLFNREKEWVRTERD